MTLDPASVDLDSSAQAAFSRICRMAQVLIVVTATLLHVVFLSKAKPLQSANDRSRWCTVWSLVERGTYQIDEIRQRPGWDTIDMVRMDGHFYSTKPPLLTTLIAGITCCVQRISGWNLIQQTQAVTFVVLLLTNIVPFVISLVAWIAILEQIAVQVWTRLFALMVAAFGTLLTPFLMTLNNHTVAAAATMIALFALVRILKDRFQPDHKADVDAGDWSDAPIANWPYALCGFAAAWTFTNELPAAAFGALLFLLVFYCSGRRTLLFFLPAAAVPIAALIATNVIATGSWKPTYADYGSEKYRFVIDGIPSYWMDPHGIDRNKDSFGTYLIHCTIGHHGLFSLSPIAIFAIAGWLTVFQQRNRVLQQLLWVGAVTSVIVMAFYMTRTQNYNYGGVSCGLRWAVWLTPFWLIATVPVVDACQKSTLFRGLTILLYLISMFSAWQPIDNPWRHPWLFQWMESRGRIDYSDPPLPKLKPERFTWFTSLPTLSGEEPAWIEFEATQPMIGRKFIRLTAKPTTSGRESQLELEIRETVDGERPPVIRRVNVDIGQFNAGAAPAEFLRWPDPTISAEQQQSDFAFVRGLPRKVPYDIRAIKYVKTPLRAEAFRCEQIVASVTCASSENDKPLTYRCDAWTTDEVPFGVIQVEFRVTQPETGQVLFQERWSVRDCWPKAKPYLPK